MKNCPNFIYKYYCKCVTNIALLTVNYKNAKNSTPYFIFTKLIALEMNCF